MDLNRICRLGQDKMGKNLYVGRRVTKISPCWTGKICCLSGGSIKLYARIGTRKKPKLRAVPSIQ